MTTIETRLATSWVIIVVAGLLIGWDVYAALQPGEGTISAVLLDFARRHPALPFAFGVIMGHLFWPQVVREKGGQP